MYFKFTSLKYLNKVRTPMNKNKTCKARQYQLSIRQQSYKQELSFLSFVPTQPSMTTGGQQGHKSQVCIVSWVQCLPLFIWIKLLLPQLRIPRLGWVRHPSVIQPATAWRMKSCNIHDHPFQALEEDRFPKERVYVGKRWLASLPQRHSFFMVPHVTVFALGQLPVYHSICRWLAQAEPTVAAISLGIAFGEWVIKSLHHMTAC